MHGDLLGEHNYSLHGNKDNTGNTESKVNLFSPI